MRYKHTARIVGRDSINAALACRDCCGGASHDVACVERFSLRSCVPVPRSSSPPRRSATARLPWPCWSPSRRTVRRATDSGQFSAIDPRALRGPGPSAVRFRVARNREPAAIRVHQGGQFGVGEFLAVPRTEFVSKNRGSSAHAYHEQRKLSVTLGHRKHAHLRCAPHGSPRQRGEGVRAFGWPA